MEKPDPPPDSVDRDLRVPADMYISGSRSPLVSCFKRSPGPLSRTSFQHLGPDSSQPNDTRLSTVIATIPLQSMCTDCARTQAKKLTVWLPFPSIQITRVQDSLHGATDSRVWRPRICLVQHFISRSRAESVIA